MDLTIITKKLEKLSEETSKAIQKAIDDLNSESGLNDPQKTLQTQFMMNQYSNFINYQGSMVKTIRDLVSGIIAKM